MASQSNRWRLAARRIPTPDERLSYRRRVVAFCEMWQDAKRKPDAIYQLQRKDPRAKLYAERERKVIHDGIRAGLIPRARLIRYRLTQLLDDLAQYPGTAPTTDHLYAAAMREVAEAVEAQTMAHALPTDEHRTIARTQTREAVAAQELLVASYEWPHPLPSHPLPMGAVR